MENGNNYGSAPTPESFEAIRAQEVAGNQTSNENTSDQQEQQVEAVEAKVSYAEMNAIKKEREKNAGISDKDAKALADEFLRSHGAADLILKDDQA